MGNKTKSGTEIKELKNISKSYKNPNDFFYLSAYAVGLVALTTIVVGLGFLYYTN